MGDILMSLDCVCMYRALIRRILFSVLGARIQFFVLGQGKRIKVEKKKILPLNIWKFVRIPLTRPKRCET